MKLKTLTIIVLSLVLMQTSNAQKKIIANVGHQSEVRCAEFSPDNKYILSAGGKDILLWNTANGRLLRIFKGHNSNVSNLVFIPNKDAFISCSGDRTLKLWNLKTGKLIRTFKGHTRQVTSLDLSKDGKFIVSASMDKSLKLWDIETGKVVQEYNGHESFVRWVAYSPDGKTIVSTGSDKTIKLWNAESGKMIKSFDGQGKYIFCAAYSPDGENIVSCAADENIKIWNKKGRLKQTISRYEKKFRRVSYSHNGKYIITSNDNTVLLLDAENGRFIREMNGHTYSVNCATFSSDDKYIISGSSDNSLILWDTESGEKVRGYDGSLHYIYHGTMSPNGRYIVSNSAYHNNIILWDAQNWEQSKILSRHTKNLCDITFTADSKTFVCAGSDNLVRFWNTDTGTEIRNLEIKVTHLESISPNGKYLINRCFDKNTATWDSENFVLWDAESGTKLKTFTGHTGYITSMSFSPDNQYIISSSKDKTVKLWSIKTGTEIRTFTGHENEVYSAIFSPACLSDPKGGKYILSSGETIKLWETETGKEIGSIKKQVGDLYNLAFSPDGKYFASGKYNIVVWETETRKEICTLPGHSKVINGIVFCPDSKKIISFSEDGIINIGDITTGKLIANLYGIKNFEDWIITTPDGYWTGSNNCGEYVAMVEGLQTWNIDQFAIINNRPDIILQRLGSNNNQLINHFNSQYKKRLRKLNLTEDALEKGFHTPSSVITNSLQNSKFVSLDINLSDSKYNLLSYNVFVNDVPVYGKGKPINESSKVLSEKVELTNGKNKIEVSCMNEKGIESYRDIVLYNYNEKITPDLYFIGLGVSNYKNPMLNLQYAHKDALDLEQKFKLMEGKGFKNVYTKTLVNEQVTNENIKAAKAFLKNAKPDDVFVLFIAGHGLHDNDPESTYYFLTYNTDFNKLSSTAANFESIEDLLQGIPPRNKLFLMDACESGEIDEEEGPGLLLAQANSRGLSARGFKAIESHNNYSQPTMMRKYSFSRNRYI